VQYLKKVPESLDSKKLNEYDLIVAMEQKHKNAVLMKCPQCNSRVVVWNVEDPYFLQEEAAKNIYDRIKARVAELAQTKD